jgi:hypothetical protein
MNAVEFYLIMLIRLGCNGYKKTSIFRLVQNTRIAFKFPAGEFPRIALYYAHKCGKKYLNVQSS